MRYKTALFDMDGTVMKTDPGVLGGFHFALDTMGLSVPEGVDERLFLGPSLEFSFSKYIGLQGEDVQRAIDLYRQYYRGGGIFQCEVYPGVRELLARLKAAGVRCLVASSKPEPFVRQILEKFQLTDSFLFAGGSDFEGRRPTKESVIAHTLSSAGLTADGCVMVGDRLYDVEGAGLFNMDCIGVTWGYGTRQELQNAGAAYIADTAEEVGNIILEETYGA